MGSIPERARAAANEAEVRANSRFRFLQEGVIKERMRLGDLLIQAKLVTVAQVAEAIELQADLGGRLGLRLVEMGAIEQKVLDAQAAPSIPDW